MSRAESVLLYLVCGMQAELLECCSPRRNTARLSWQKDFNSSSTAGKLQQYLTACSSYHSLAEVLTCLLTHC